MRFVQSKKLGREIPFIQPEPSKSTENTALSRYQDDLDDGPDRTVELAGLTYMQK